jgi:cell division protein FtsA
MEGCARKKSAAATTAAASAIEFMKKRVVALDLGSSKAAALAAETADDGRIRVLGASVVPCKGLRKGIVIDLEEAAKSVEEVLRDLQNDLADPIDMVLLSVGGQHVEAIHTQGFLPIYPRSRPISREDVLQVINHSRRHVLPPDREELQAIPQEFSIDGQAHIARPIGMNGSKLEVKTLLITAHTPHLQNLEKSVTMSGRRVSQFILKGLAAGLAVLSPDQIENGAAVIDIGAGTAEIAVFANGSISYAASIPIGGSLVTSDISKLLKTAPEEAERLKLKAGNAMAQLVPEEDSVGVMQLGQIHERPMQRRVLCEIIESRMRELATIARQQLERSGLYGMLPGGVVLTGGGSQLPGTAELFNRVLEHHKVTVSTPHVAGKASFSAETPDMAVTVGMTRFALDSNGEELETAGANGSIAGKIKTIWSLLSGKS